MQKPNKPVFSKGSSAQNPPPHSALMFPTVTLMWKKWITTLEIIMPVSSYPQHSPHRNPELTNLRAAYFVSPLNPHIKSTDASTLKKSVQAPSVSGTPHELSEWPTSGSCWVTSVVDRFSSQHVKIVSISGCLCLHLILLLWFGSTWLVDNTEQVVVKGLQSSCLFPILSVVLVDISPKTWEISHSRKEHVHETAKDT